jgi:superfamily II DNA or RNA helicase
MHLRPYQQEAIAAVWRDWQTHTDVIGVAATGAGKTNVFLSIAMAALDSDPSARVLILSHRRELVHQPLERIPTIDPAWLLRCSDRPRIGVVMDTRNDFDRQLTSATVQSLSIKRLERLLAHGAITHLIIDEAHHSVASTYVRIVDTLKTANPELRHLGVTATPQRGDGDGLIKIYQKEAFKITIADLVKQHYLVQPRWLGISTGFSLKGVSTSNGDFNQAQLASVFDTAAGREIVTRAYSEYAAGRQAVAFTASVAGAHDLADSFNALGIRAAALDGTTPKDERARVLKAYAAGEYQVLANCALLTEGWDCPSVSCLLMCRPTKSDGAYVQMIGRGLRPANGTAEPGEDCLILDFLPADSRNIVMAGDVLGLPKEKTKAVDELLKEEAEPGEVQAGFTFDGEDFHSSGTPLEIIARQLDYLNASPFRWHRHDGWLTLGLGLASDGNERLLAVPPAVEGRYTLYGVLRTVTETDGRRIYGNWRSREITSSDDLSIIGDEATIIVERWGSSALTSKGRSWHNQPCTEGQAKYLRRLAGTI